MSQFNKESNGFIIQFTVVMVVVVAVSLALVSSVLKPMAKFNAEAFEKTKILKSVLNLDAEAAKSFGGDKAAVNKMYADKITEYIVSYDGEATQVEQGEAFNLKVKEEFRKADEDKKMPMYVYEDGGKKYYIIPLIGLGLWDEISGYLALEGDFNTVQGAVFDHKGETPGLGAEIATFWFQDQFNGKQLMNEKDKYKFLIEKGKDDKEEGVNNVDGVSGATITCDGANAMLKKCYAMYAPFFEKNAKETASL